MPLYKYQMHCHTSPCSHCAEMSPSDLCKALYDANYNGCVLTNHFFNGNTGIDRTLPWEEFVSFYEKDYLECKREALKYNLDILFGVEEHIGNGNEILCYGLTPEMLYSHPELHERNLKLWYETLSSLGVTVIQAHPFRKKSYISNVGVLSFDYIDGIEVYNYCNSDLDNSEASDFASLYPDIIFTSGADCHSVNKVCHGGILVENRISSEVELPTLLKSRNYSLICE